MPHSLTGSGGIAFTTPWGDLVAWDNLNPDWNYTIVVADFEPSDSLEFTIYDKDQVVESECAKLRAYRCPCLCIMLRGGAAVVGIYKHIFTQLDPKPPPWMKTRWRRMWENNWVDRDWVCPKCMDIVFADND